MTQKKENITKGIEEQIRSSLRKLSLYLSQQEIATKLKEKGITRIGDPASLSRFMNGEYLQPKYYNDVIEAIKDILIEEPNTDNTNLYKSYYFPVLKNSLKTKLSGNCPLKFYSDLLNISESDVISFLSANPIVLFSNIHSGFGKYSCSKFVEYNSDDAELVALNDVKSFLLNNTKKVSLKHIKKSILGHALSPFSDSIFLFCELGRYLRLSKTLGIERIGILITDTNWAKLNYSVTELENQISNIIDNLDSCLKFRKELYNNLGFNDIEVIEKHHVNSIDGKNINTLEKEAVEFELYCRLLEPIIEQIDFENRKIDIPSLIKRLSDVSQKEKLELLSLTIVNDLKNLYTISVVKQYFKGTDSSTFLYALLQRYILHDTKYKHALKVGVESEKKFDFAFAKMDAFEGVKEKIMNSVYFSHYNFEKGLNIIPYTFPSGNFKEKYKTGYENKAILIFDFLTDSRKDKVRTIVSKIELEQLAIQLSDLFSFANYFKFNDNDGFEVEMFDLLEKFDFTEVKESWLSYKKNPDLLNHFKTNMFSMWFDSVVLPYYFYPYIIAFKCIEENDNQLESKFREFSYEFIILLTKNVCETIKILDEWR